MREYPIYVAGRFTATAKKTAVTAPFSGETIGEVFIAGDAEAEESAAAALASFKETRKLAPLDRAAILMEIHNGIAARAGELARVIALEAGKPILNARQEVQRSIFTFLAAAEETKRISGEVLPLDIHPLAKGRQCFVKRFPIGPILGITPFNFPLNLVAHKAAPAMAAGNPIVIKPAPQTPLTALLLAEIVDKSGWPKGAFSVLPATNELAETMARDARYKMLSFTGSPGVGWMLKNIAGKKKVALELGGNAGVIVHGDADLEYAAGRIVTGGFSYAGQTCISVQRVFVQQGVYEKFKALFIPKVATLKTGDPLDEATSVGPLISPREVQRILGWIDEAVEGGAKILCGGKGEGSILQPAVLERTTPRMKVNCMEVFGPVVTLTPYATMDEALALLNDGEFGLQAGVFTNDLRASFAAWETLDVGGVMIGDVPTFRIDHMPYGGVKGSGLGREGLRYAIEEMTEPKSLVINLP
ncbi:MAG: aldehyde dehydrogenase family protein [Nitrospinae bacterium]|nr:aldehyde dehydrogenase family protein [Nitrospinota bacterium]